MAYDLVLKNARIVSPGLGMMECDIGISEGKIASLSREIPRSSAGRTFDIDGKVVFPGIVDAHSHFGIYRPLVDDAVSESSAAVTGGITTVINIIRPRPYYLNMTGSLESVFQKLLELSKETYLCDYGYTLAPVEKSHLQEIPKLAREGVPTFKFFMHYRDFKFSDEPYDTGFLFELMKTISSANKNFNGIRLSLHCEDPDIIRVSGHTGYGIRTGEAGRSEEQASSPSHPLEAYNKARPPIAEAVAVAKAIQMANYTGCPINILHMSSRLAVETAINLSKTLPVDLTLEAVIHHLMLTTRAAAGVLAKVNPPIRTSDDVEALWQAIKLGQIQVVASDHSCVQKEFKREIWSALFGFGGNTLLLPGMISEGYHKRGISLLKIAELVSYNPATIHGLYPRKGSIMVGSDADLTIVDINKTQKVTVELLHSAQDFTPYEGLEVTGWPIMTIVRGEPVYEDGAVTGKPGHGEFIKRPVSVRYD